MRTGLISGSIAAIVVALVSLPLHSPVDNVFNTASVAAASLFAGVAAGLFWNKLAASQRRAIHYAGGLALGLIAVVALAAVGEIWLERMLSFTIPLAVIAFALSGHLNLDGGPSEVSVDLHSLSSDQSFRDRYIRDRMFRNSPVAVFTVDDLDELPPEFFDGETITRQVTGTINVNEADFPLTFDLEVRNDGDALKVLGRTKFT